ncbi:MAG TPA: heme ABC exporter ATP-binding protein CcmA [Nitrospiria bacterium]|nr:heme ABC exporter ATP-binding protein CcmA [Nitrospiria bacterium]
MSAVRVIELAKAHGHYRVFERVSFELLPGECLALFGPNGAGKTTLIRVLATLSRPSAGRFEIDGKDGVRDKDAVRTSLLLLAHGSHLYDELDGAENLRFSLALRGLTLRDRDIKSALDRVGIGAFSDLKTRYYSAGMKKRLTIAKSMLVRPKVLLLDEPYTSLDEAGIALVNEHLRALTRDGAAVLMSTHDRARSADVAHRAGVLDKGHWREVAVERLKTDALF